ncbi:MAG: adenylate/guanylate cyclase domain-containing protein [Spirochaetales bacterium]|nr:MAG: adenylate/guanylate cyclase domain-containing protein [Spirochaetales bacterium]
MVYTMSMMQNQLWVAALAAADPASWSMFPISLVGARGAEAALWLAAGLFVALLGFYRRRARPYASLACFLTLSAASMSVSGFLPSLAGGAIPIWTVAMALRIAASAAAVAFTGALAGRTLTTARWILYPVAVLGAAAGIAVPAILGEAAAGWTALAVGMVQAGLAIVAVWFFIAHAALNVPSRRVVPAAAIRALAALVILVPLPVIRPYASAASVAAEILFAATAILAAMMELSHPSAEETILDDRAVALTASIRKFIPNEFLSYLQKKDILDLNLGDHIKKDMTIFFSDIRAFTELSEILTPEESFAFVNSYLSRVVPVITGHRGFVDKYMGDGIMALFPEDTGADDAVESAVEMQKKMQVYNGHRAKVGYRSVSMGIGIHTGPLMMGVVGVSDRMEGTVISDSVNLASRLQAIAKAFNIPLVISEDTFRSMSEAGKYKYRFIGKALVKGKDKAVSAFEIFDGLPDELFERKMRSNTFFEQGMLAFYQKDISGGAFYFKRALEEVPEDGAARFWLETCLRKTMAPRAT